MTDNSTKYQLLYSSIHVHQYDNLDHLDGDHDHEDDDDDDDDDNDDVADHHDIMIIPRTRWRGRSEHDPNPPLGRSGCRLAPRAALCTPLRESWPVRTVVRRWCDGHGPMV